MVVLAITMGFVAAGVVKNGNSYGEGWLVMVKDSEGLLVRMPR
jgi:hypothetical protein